VTAILGISAFYHDSAAALVLDGDLVAAAQEERFSRIKHDASFPSHAVGYCLQEAGLTDDQLDYIAYYDKPLTKLDRLLETYLGFAPAGLRSFCRAMPSWLKEKVCLRRVLRRNLGGSRAPILFLEHHESHAASAFFPSPFESAAILTLDGVGEWTTTAFGVGRGNRIQLTHDIHFPHSLGLLYSAFTYYCGFKVNGGEYKLMGLAPYGQPVYAEVIRRQLMDLKPDGSFWLDQRYFNYCQGLTMTSRRFHRLFGGPPRRPESALEQRHMDLAASIQAVTEEVVLRMARHLHRQTRLSKLVLAGGVALNCVVNGRLLREGPFEDIWIQPAAGDAGGALGAALFVWHQLLCRSRVLTGTDSQKGSLLGPSYSSMEVEAFLKSAGARYHRLVTAAEDRLLSVPEARSDRLVTVTEDRKDRLVTVTADRYHRLPSEPADRLLTVDDLARRCASLLAEGLVVGWFQGRMEFGPRALGARSILADPRRPDMQAVLNRKIKFREGFRPFAPAVLLEQAAAWLDLPLDRESPYMLLTCSVKECQRLPLSAEQRQTMQNDPDLCRRAAVPRSTIPAVTHVDYSARPQTVDAKRQPRFHRLLQAFYEQTGCPMLVNTSFNIRGEPIVCTPADAYRCFLATDMDALVLDDFLLLKSDVAEKERAGRREELLAAVGTD
jgi:carbamoyltransferase